MTPYATFSTDAFVQDEYFQQWVFSPDAATDAFWAQFLEAHPTQRKTLAEARQFLLLFDQAEQDVLASRLTHLKRRIDAAIENSKFKVQSPKLTGQELPGPEQTSRPRRQNGWVAYAVAASVTLLVVSGYLLYCYVLPEQVPMAPS